MDGRFQLLIKVTALALVTSQSTDAQEWTRFRGPNGTGISEAESIPTSWTEDDYNWKVDLPGIGHASPVLWGENIFIHTADVLTGTRPATAESESATRSVMCLHTSDGRTLWKKSFPSTLAKGYRVRAQNSLASSTPVVDDRHVYTAWSQGDATTLKVFTHGGELVWERELGPYLSGHGFCTSPIIFDNLVILQLHQRLPRDEDPVESTESCVLALDRTTGRTVWKTIRENSLSAAHAVPFLYNQDGSPIELVMSSRKYGITSYNPRTGAVNWSLESLDRRPIGSPIFASGLIFGTSGSGSGGDQNKVVAVRPGTSPEIVYEVKKHAPYVPTLIAKGDLVFLWYDKGGIVTCIDGPSGEIHWKERVGGDFFSSPIIIGDRIFCTDVQGTTVVLAASKNYRLLAKNRLRDDMHASPAVAGGRLYLRTFRHLISLGGRKKI
ncbi:MAG: PQQ-like beta-propeller repeat protein [Fuerstiella sp.]|nr:PQQ-like beta-propeller repeat protein [Fuerstiella sp.]